jgi:threonine dehydratase
MKRYGASIEFYGDDCIDSEIKAREASIKDGKIYISPYNDLEIIEGQGSIGYEISNQVNQPLDAIIVSVGGGGLISGISGYLKSIWPNVKIIGCSPTNSAVMLHSIKAGEILELQSKLTLSDGTAGGVEKGSVTFPFCENYIDESVLVSEKEIKEALVTYMDTEHQMIEGAAGTAVAALIKKRDMLKDKRVGVIICGGNMNLTTIKSLL